jgi:hypothetical protein
MKSLENARNFFRNCESGKGWDACKDYVQGNGKFDCQSEPFAEVKEIKDYTEAMAGLANATMPGSSFEIHASALDENTNTVLVFATFIGTHSGEGGPIPPTNKTTNSHYVFAMQMNDQDLVQSMTKIWNSSWAFKELGWM